MFDNRILPFLLFFLFLLVVLVVLVAFVLVETEFLEEFFCFLLVLSSEHFLLLVFHLFEDVFVSLDLESVLLEELLDGGVA